MHATYNSFAISGSKKVMREKEEYDYVGELNAKGEPHGLGKLSKGPSDDYVEIEGHFLDGQVEGIGKFSQG